VTAFEITPAERAGWQRRAVKELAAILDAHRGLPVIAWTVGSAGATVVGHVGGGVPAGQVRQVFHLWCTALTLTEQGRPTAGVGAAQLRAMAHRNRVLVRLTATVLDERDAGVVSS
jgi:hypothetical protein